MKISDGFCLEEMEEFKPSSRKYDENLSNSPQKISKSADYSNPEAKTKPSKDPVEAILKNMGDNSILSREEVVELAKRIEEGDEKAKEELFYHNQRLVVSIAKKYRGRGIPFEDLIQEGYIGLLKGIEKYDYTKGSELPQPNSLRS